MRTWQFPDQPIFLRLASTRGPSTAIQGAISNKRGGFCWATSKRNNGESYLAFLRILVTWVGDKKNCVIVADQATYHGSAAIKEFLKNEGMSLLYLPPSSSDLNPVVSRTLAD